MKKINSDQKINPKYQLTVGIVICAVILIAFLTSVYFFTQSQKAPKDLFGQSSGPESQLASVIETISKFMELPVGESPQVESVTSLNIDQAKANPIFSKAQIGDIVLFYRVSGKIIIYRPATKKVINVATIPIQPTPLVPTTSQDGQQQGIISGTEEQGNFQPERSQGGSNSESVTTEPTPTDSSTSTSGGP